MDDKEKIRTLRFALKLSEQVFTALHKGSIPPTGFNQYIKVVREALQETKDY